MFELIGFVLAAGVILYGYTATRRFVRSRLRFVDGVQNPRGVVLAAIGAVLVSLPLFMLLPVPFFGAMTAMLFGLSIGAGVRAGARDVRKTAGYIEGP